TENDRFEINSHTPLEIADVFINGKGNKDDKNFKCSDALKIDIHIESQTHIEHPTWTVDVVRADGVICCSTNSKETQFNHDIHPGKKTIKINFGKLNLSPGVYHLSIGLWDHDMAYNYAIRNKDFFRIYTDKIILTPEAVFLPMVSWE